MSSNSYPLHPDLKRLSLLKLPSDLSVYPLLNFFLSKLAEREHSTKLLRVRKKTINGYKGSKINLIIYEPYTLPADAPCLVYYHGGGMVMKAAPYHYNMVKSYSLAAQCKVIMVDYSVIPGVIFPTPAEECYKAYVWTVKNAINIGIDPCRIAVGGDSAGGGLAAAVSMMSRDRHAPMPCFQMLLYPAVDKRCETYSMKKYYNTPVLDSGIARLMWKLYLPLGKNHKNIQYASLMEADSLKGMPDTYIETAEFDCLHDEGINFAEKLKNDGVNVLLYNTKGTPHAFDCVSDSRITRKCIKIRTGQLKEAFEKNKGKGL